MNMKKYVVAVANIFEGTNEISVIYAHSPLEALQEILNIRDVHDINDLVDIAFDGGFYVTIPVLLDDLK